MARLIDEGLTRPTSCDCCKSPNIRLTTASKANREQYGEWPLLYLCDDCDASIRCHIGTSIPLGFMAQRNTRRLRWKAHAIFDALWMKSRIPRAKAYNWLSKELNIELQMCHIAMFDAVQCKLVIQLCESTKRIY